MIRDGQKFACESCVRGHRVSNCTHEDRPLTLIKPKGRPVKQCEHCRSSRKSKSHHGKCDCGSKKDKKDKDEAKPVSESGCCCDHGERCLCGNKGHNDAVRMERSLKRSSTAPTVKSKPLSKCHSDAKLTLKTDGHHPAHRHNNAAHESGAPYPHPRKRHTLHGSDFVASPQQLEMLSLISGGGSNDELFSYRSSDIFSSPNSRPLSLSGSRSNSSDSFDPENSLAFDFDLIGGSVDYDNYNAFGDNWPDITSPTSPQLGTATSGVSQTTYVPSPNFVDEYAACHSNTSELPDIAEYSTYPSSSGTRETGSDSEESLATPIQGAVDGRYHHLLGGELSDSASQNSLDRWSTEESELDMLSSVATSRTYSSSSSNARSLPEDVGYPASIDSVVAEAAASNGASLEMGMSLPLDLSTLPPAYIDAVRRYEWL